MPVLIPASVAILATLWVAALMAIQLRRLAASGRLAAQMRGPVPPPTALPLSLIIPIKGPFQVDHLGLALDALQGCNAELLVAVETLSDPAWEMAERFRQGRDDPRLGIVLTGPCPPGANGKVHNLLHGVAASHGALLLFADADVALTPALVRHAADLLQQNGVGAVFAPPYYS
ncbi:MAG TPA: glycosyltransferase family 2 protein, partial [bacterium]|nr:glycosyltransferase family 2 protein [bacterium]